MEGTEMTLGADDLEYLKWYAHKLMLVVKWTHSDNNPYWEEWNDGKVVEPQTTGYAMVWFKDYGFLGDVPWIEKCLEIPIPTNDWTLKIGKLKYSAKTTKDEDLEAAIFAALVKEIQNLVLPEEYTIKELLFEPRYFNTYGKDN